MDTTFTIGDVSKLLNIPAPTLRFWEERGLYTVEKGDNDYRRYTVRDLTRIADVMFFRNLGLPISGIEQLQNCSLEHYAGQLQDTQAQLEEKLRIDMQMYQRTLRQLQRLQAVQELMQHEVIEEDIPFDAVAAFDYEEESKLRQYAEDPSSYVRYFDTRDMSTELRGIIASADNTNNLLWQKCPGSHFVTFLIREQVDHNYASDVTQSLARLRSQYDTRYMLAQYMLSAQEDGQQIDYLKAYVEVEARMDA